MELDERDVEALKVLRVVGESVGLELVEERLQSVVVLVPSESRSVGTLQGERASPVSAEKIASSVEDEADEEMFNEIARLASDYVICCADPRPARAGLGSAPSLVSASPRW